MDAVLDADHVILLLRFLFARTRATAGQPQPMLRFLGAEPDQIRRDLEANGAIVLPGLINDEIDSSIPDLMKILDCFLNRQPRLTRGFATKTRDMEAWLSNPGQRGKMERIGQAFPNTLGPAGGLDNLTSFTDYISDVFIACEVVTKRLTEGQKWFSDYSSMCLSLSKVRTMLPKVQLSLSDKSELIDESRLLVNFRENFFA